MPVTKIVPKVCADSDPLVALYVYGVFDSSDQSNWPNFPAWIGYIQDSAFNVVVFSTFHVDMAGNLYGSVPLVTDGTFNPNGDLSPDLPSLYAGLQQSGKTLLYSIGNSAGTGNDLDALEQILADPTSAAYANLQNNMGVLSSTLGITGIDFDFEGFYDADAQGAVTAFTTFCNALGLFVTYCPYEQEQFWIDAQTAAVSTSNGSVAWWNLQCYPDLPNSPEGWLPAIQANAPAMGVSDPTTFLVPGTVASQGTVAATQQFSQWAGATQGLNGGFIWQFGNLVPASTNPCPPWADAVIDGLANPTSSATVPARRQSR